MTLTEPILDVESQQIEINPKEIGSIATRFEQSTTDCLESQNLEFSVTSNVEPEEYESAGASDLKEDYIGTFPLMYDLETFTQYRLHRREFFDIYECITPSIFFVIALVTRYNISNSATNGPYFNLSLCSVLFGSVLYSVFLCMNMAKCFLKNSNSNLRQMVKSFESTWFGQNIEDFLTLFGTLMTGFLLYGRVYNGQCGCLDIWKTQVNTHKFIC